MFIFIKETEKLLWTGRRDQKNKSFKLVISRYRERREIDFFDRSRR